MTGPDPAWDPWTDQSYLRESQYKQEPRAAGHPAGRGRSGAACLVCA